VKVEEAVPAGGGAFERHPGQERTSITGTMKDLLVALAEALRTEYKTIVELRHFAAGGRRSAPP